MTSTSIKSKMDQRRKSTPSSFRYTSITIYITHTILLTLVLSDIAASQDSFNDYAASINDLYGTSPLILPPDTDVTVLPSEDFKFRCQSTEPISWRLPEEFSGKYKVSHSHLYGEERPYEAALELFDIDYTYVGYYYCVNNATNDDEREIEDLLQDYKASKIYLFVEDPNHPLADIQTPLLVGDQYKDIVIPCKPTSRKSSVELIKEGDESHRFESKFSPTIGYTIKLMELTDGGSYMCRPQHDDSGEHDIHLNVQVNSGTSYINRPTISSKTENFGIEGDELELNCSVQSHAGTKFTIDWILPNHNIAEKEQRVEKYGPKKEMDETHPELVIGVSRLIVKQLDKAKDVGIYKCEVRDHSENRNSNQLNVIKILGKDESFINITEPSGRYKIEMSSKKAEAKWHVKFSGHPPPTLVWRDIRGNEIPWSSVENKDRKFEALLFKDYTVLKIRNPELIDSGDYTLVADNGPDHKEQKFQLLVKQLPQLTTADVKVKPGEAADLSCDVFGYPASTISWSFIPCNNFAFDQTSCDPSRKITYSVWSKNELPIAVGDEVSVTCAASAYKYATELNWFRDERKIESSEDVQVILHNTPYSHRKELRWRSIDKNATGNYVCRANVIKDDTSEYREWYLDVTEPTNPVIDFSNLKEGVSKFSLGEPLRLTCRISGVPRPEIRWYKDDAEIMPDDNDTRTAFHENNTVLDIKYIRIEDQGKFKCVASNRLGSVARETVLKISNMPTVSKALIIGVVALILLLIICTIFLCLRIYRQRKLLRELKAAGLANFEEGNPDSINPDLALDEQADLLPYDKKYEFPRDKLKLGKQLGAGAFGVVVKGYATGILPHEEETIVAVKMVKQTADNEVMRALISELKIMVHLGQHLNVVNLLGAVTKNIAKREVMVIVEYCRFGNLQNFLVKHRDYFVDQIVRDKDIIDPSILTKEQRWSNDSGYEYFNSQGLKYVKVSFKNNNQKHQQNNSGKGDNRRSADAVSHVNSAYIRHSSVTDYFPGGMDSANTEATLISRNTPGGEDNFVMSNNSTQPAWRSNYRMDYKGPARTVTTTDILCWAFQVSRGMQYLSSRKVLHGDLAARNILLCDDNVVKICDFGLARSMYKSDNYKKKGEAPLPFKWLAIESISDQVFSTYSDVCSFGIVLWELFSLGKVPYPGMDADQGLYFKLKDGYRMEKPDYATQDIYDIMLQCWSAHPESRPLFDSLEKSLGKLLENGVAEHYIDLNEPYLQVNVENFTSGQTDYLALMAAPDCQAPSAPTYVNSHIIAMPPTSNAPSIPNYLTMSPAINSPADGVDTHDTHFQFPALNSPTTANNLNANTMASKFRSKIPDIPEEIPMLKRSNQSINTDSEPETNSPNAHSADQTDGRFNALQSSSNDATQKNQNVLNATADNYVNVPSTMITVNDKKDAVSNPGYVVVGNIHETRT